MVGSERLYTATRVLSLPQCAFLFNLFYQNGDNAAKVLQSYQFEKSLCMSLIMPCSSPGEWINVLRKQVALEFMPTTWTPEKLQTTPIQKENECRRIWKMLQTLLLCSRFRTQQERHAKSSFVDLAFSTELLVYY